MKSIKSIAIIAMLLSVTFAYSQRSDNNGERWDTDNVLTLSGTITEVNHPIAKFKADNGTEYDIHMGPLWFWEDNKLELKKNENAQIKAEVKGNEIYPWEIEQNGNKMSFADEQGVPKWNKGNGKGNGKNKGNGNGWKKGNGHNGQGKGKCRQ